jgi:diguanylate cyclase (GGDEF)-like protein
MPTHDRPLVPPDPTGSRSLAGGSGEADALRSKLAVQRNRALVYGFAGAVMLLTKVTGIASFDWLRSLAVLGAGYLTVLLFVVLVRRRQRQGRPARLEAWWISCDVVLITAMIWLTGGVASPWFLWYLACAGAAAAHCSLRVSVAGAALTAILYLAALVTMGQIRGLDAGLASAASHLLFLLGSSLFLLLNTRRLRQSVAVNRQLRQQAVERVEELTRVTRDLEAMSRLLQDFTETDPLTGLHNRRYFLDRIAQDAERFAADRRVPAQRRTSGITMVDLDNFKGINDSHGHSAGDQLLKHLAQILRRTVRTGDRIVRWGGDEFVILLPQAEEDTTEEVAQRIVTAVRSQPIQLADGGVHTLSCSVGWSVIDWQATAGEPAPWESAMAAADAALSACKAAGGGCSRYLPPLEEGSQAAPVAEVAAEAAAAGFDTERSAA